MEKKGTSLETYQSWYRNGLQKWKDRELDMMDKDGRL